MTMIHYHGTPISGSALSVAALAGRHAMVSFIAPQQLAEVAEVTQSFVLDNGAFSAWRSGKPITDWSEFYDWVAAWKCHPGFDWALIPDVIDGSENDNDALIDEWPFEAWIGVPVWHLHESIDRLIGLCARWPRIAFGSSGQWKTPGASGWWRRMDEAMAAICMDGRPVCKLHGLRMLDPAIFTRLPFASADSTNAAVNAGSIRRFGQYLPPDAGLRARVIMDRIEAHNSAPVWLESQQINLEGIA